MVGRASEKRTEPTKRGTRTRRGSPEAVQKRRSARRLNGVLGEASPGEKVDLRTERRRRRLLRELAEGRGGQALKPITVLQHADELLKMGSTATAVRKAAGGKYKVASISPEILDVASRAQVAYGFDLRAWTLLGIDPSQLVPSGRG